MGILLMVLIGLILLMMVGSVLTTFIEGIAMIFVLIYKLIEWAFRPWRQ